MDTGQYLLGVDLVLFTCITAAGAVACVFETRSSAFYLFDNDLDIKQRRHHGGHDQESERDYHDYLEAIEDHRSWSWSWSWS